jgi:hypothetical protein
MIYFFFKITFLKYIIFFCCFDNKMIIYCSIVHWIKSDNNKNNILKTIIIWIKKKKKCIFLIKKLILIHAFLFCFDEKNAFNYEKYFLLI